MNGGCLREWQNMKEWAMSFILQLQQLSQGEHGRLGAPGAGTELRGHCGQVRRRQLMLKEPGFLQGCLL